ncbi:MAG: TlpA disulfide reductase family protein [Rhodospirillaceae bacterium]|nr:TlpA disulfide reductase family protein [Rhodospirillaceae bacterium]
MIAMTKLKALVTALMLVACAAGPARAADAVEAISPAAFKQVLAAEQGKVVVVNLWATWCAPCLTEIPDLMRMAADLAEFKVALIGVSVDEPRGDTGFIAAMRDRRFPGFRTYARDQTEVDYLVSVIDPAWNEVVPTTYVLGRDGTVKKRIQGKKSLAEFMAEVRAVAAAE